MDLIQSQPQSKSFDNGLGGAQFVREIADALREFRRLMVVGAVICSLITLGAIFADSVSCARKAPHLPSGGVHVWETFDPTIERFFDELAQENPIRFTAQQLCAFTGNYTTVLGSGGFGKVYEGQFPNGVKIVVKVITRSVEDQFMSEVGTILRTRHKNLVRLYGFCYDRYMSALVYELMENNSNESLDWFPKKVWEEFEKGELMELTMYN